jgi:hypothetical protein
MGREEENLVGAVKEDFKPGVGNKLPNPWRHEDTDKFEIYENN